MTAAWGVTYGVRRSRGDDDDGCTIPVHVHIRGAVIIAVWVLSGRHGACQAVAACDAVCGDGVRTSSTQQDDNRLRRRGRQRNELLGNGNGRALPVSGVADLR